MMVSYRDIEDRLHTGTDTRCGGYPERGPFGSEEEAQSATDLLPPWATIVKVHQDNRGWWAVYTCTTSTSLLPTATIWERNWRLGRLRRRLRSFLYWLGWKGA